MPDARSSHGKSAGMLVRRGCGAVGSRNGTRRGSRLVLHPGGRKHGYNGRRIGCAGGVGRELRNMKMAPSPLHSQRMHRKIAPHPDDSHDYDQDLDILGVVSK